MQYDQFERQLKAGPALPAYVLVGPETFFKREAIARLRHKVVGKSDPQLCFLQFEGDEVGPVDVFDELRTRSFFAGEKLMIVHSADRFVSQHSAALAKYLKKPSASAVLVLVAEKLDGRTAAAKALRDGLVECKRVYDNKVPGWLAGRARHHKVKLPRDAAMLLAEQVGADLVQLDLQLEKLALLAGPGGAVTRDHVARIVGHDKLVDVFNLTDAVSEGETGRALDTLHHLLEGGEYPGRVLTMLAWQFRRLRNVLGLLSEGLAGKDLARRAGASPYFIDGLVRQARRFPLPDLVRKQRLLHHSDVALKSGSEGDGGVRIMEHLVIQLCR